MRLYLRLAWRNLWRHRRRTLIVVLAWAYPGDDDDVRWADRRVRPGYLRQRDQGAGWKYPDPRHRLYR